MIPLRLLLSAAFIGMLPLTAQAAGTSFYPADAARGQEKAAVCLSCHGVEGMKLGAPPIHVPKLRFQRESSIYYALLDYKSGARKSDLMTPMIAGLSDQDMRDVSAYLAGVDVGGPPVAEMQGTWAHEKVHRDCTACHGEGGVGTLHGVPVIAGQHEDYLLHALQEYKSGKRSHVTMGAIAARLTDDEIKQLAKYFSVQHHLELAK
jgi:cytochrome c553